MEVIGKKYYTISTEEITTKFWEENKIFQKSIDNNCNNKKFVFYDGPPFATGLPHYGHILAGLIKDTIGRWATIKGHYVPRRAGWDTHGLPIEHKVDKEYKFENKNDILKFGIGNYNEECRKIVMTCASQWKTIMGRLGRWVDFDDDYKTMDIEYMSKVWNVFSRIYEKNMIYEGVKVMPYSIALKTPISSSESSENYQEINSKTMVVKFKINNTDNNEYISDIIGIKKLVNRNNSEKRGYNHIYKEVKKTIAYEKSYLNNLLDTKIMHLFYSDSDIEQFYSKYKTL